MNFQKYIIKGLVLVGIVLNFWFASVNRSHAQGMVFSFDSPSYTIVKGNSLEGSISISESNDPDDAWDYTDIYGYRRTADNYYTVWGIHFDYNAPADIYTGGSLPSNTQYINWEADDFNEKDFSIFFPDDGNPGPDVTGPIAITAYDPYWRGFSESDDPYDAYINNNPFYWYCRWIYANVAEDSSATVTLKNPNTIMNASVVGPSIMMEGPIIKSTSIRISRADSYNARTVLYNVSGNALSGVDYAGSLTLSVFLDAGVDHVDIPISTISQSVPFPVAPRTLTITLIPNASGSYKIGTSPSATILFTYPNLNNPGSAQLFDPTMPLPEGLKIGDKRDGPFGTNVPTTSSYVSTLSAFINVQATAPYATKSGPTPGVFTISRSGGTNAVTVTFTITGTAVSGSNYTALPTNVTFAANQISTNLLVNVLTNLTLTNARTVVLSLSASTNSSYFRGASEQAVVTLLPNSSLTNSVTSPVGRYWRGSGSDPTYWSQVIPLDYQKGTLFSNLNGNCSNLFGVTSWSNVTLYHYNAASTLSQTNITNRIPFNNPIVAFGERTGGTPLYLDQPYSFGIYAGDPLHVPNNVFVQAFYRSNMQSAGTITLVPPNYSNSASMLSYATNGFQVVSNAFGLTCSLSDSPSLTWGAASLGAFILTHTASSDATNYYFLVKVAGDPADGTNGMVIKSDGSKVGSMLYTLEFAPRPPWRSIALEKPQFQGSPLPPFYAGKSLDEILTNTPPVTNSVSFTPSLATNIDLSPELRRHPILDQFVADMGNDPVVLANFVMNEIDLTDPMGYSDNGNVAEQSVNFGGVSRGALGVYLEKQGSPVEQCALLIYLLRQAGVPAVYEFAPRDGLKLLDARLSQILKTQVRGAFTEAGKLYTTNTMISVNYPWVAAYIGTNWVHIFPWLKDYQLSEGFDLYDYMPSNYPTAYPWVKDYVYGSNSLLSLMTNGGNTPGAIFPAFLKQTLLQNHPGVSVDDIGVKIMNRPHYYARWQDFPTPTWLTNVSTPVESLTATAITNVDPALTNIFDTLNIRLYSVNKPTNAVMTGDLRLVDLHNREFYVRQTVTNSTNVQLQLILLPFRPGITNQSAYTNDANLLNKEVSSIILDPAESQLGMRIRYRRNRSFAITNGIDPTAVFLGYNSAQAVNLERMLWKGDQAAICMNYGRVTRDMINVHAQNVWQQEAAVRANPSLSNSISPDIYLGEVMNLAGLSYYQNVSRFDQINQNLHKINNLSSWAMGLSKISAGRDSQGALTNGTDPILPNLDMFFYQTALVGNGTVQSDSGRAVEQAHQNYNLISIANFSAEEHHTLNHFFKQTDAVSTVRLLQLASNTIVALNFSNYVNKATNVYQGARLQDWDPGLWSTVSGALNGSPYTLAYITPGPMSNSAYAGMGALILGWNQWQALITPGSLNGGFATPLPTNTFTSTNFPKFSLDGVGDLTLSLSTPVIGSELAQNNTASFNTLSFFDQLRLGTYGIDPDMSAWSTTASNLFGLAGNGTPEQNFATNFIFARTSGDLGTPDDYSGRFALVFDPVNPVTGQFLVDETDVQLPGPLPLVWRRNYSSQNLADNQFGPGWKSSLMPYLVIATGSTNIYAADMDGSVLAYVRTNSSTNVWVPTLAANPHLNNDTTSGVGGLVNRLRDRIEKTTNGSTTNYTLYGADGSIRAFQLKSFNNGIVTNTRPYLQQWTDNQGNYLLFNYGTNSAETDFGQVSQIQCNNGNFLQIYYDEYGHVTEVYTGDGRNLYYEYDEYNDLVRVTLPDSTTRSYIYKHGTQIVTNGTAQYSTHLIIEEDKPDGRAVQNAYDGQRRVTNQLSTAGLDLTPVRTASFVYSNNFKFTNIWTNTITGFTLIIDGNNKTNRYDYSNSFITKITDPLNRTIQQSWYGDNATSPGYPRSVATRIDQRGLVTQYQYDANGNVTNKTVTGDLVGNGATNDVAVSSALYNSNSLPVLMLDPVGNGVSNVYDSTFTFLPKFVVRLVGTNPIITNYMIYTNMSVVVTNGNIVQTNSAFGLVTRTIRAYGSPDAATNDLRYNGAGFVTNAIQYTGTVDPAITNYLFYNERNEMIERTDAAGRVYTFAYDDMGRRIATETFDVGQDLPMDWSYFYFNDNGELQWVDGPRYNPEDYIFYDYDGAGRKIQETHWRSQGNQDGSGVSAVPGYGVYSSTFFRYDVLGNLTNITDPLGNYTVQGFDAVGQMLSQVFYASNGTSLATNFYAYEQGGLVSSSTNALGGVTTKLYNSRGQLKFQKNADGSTNGWRYDLSGRVVKEFARNGNVWLSAYDDANFKTTKIYSNATVALATNITQTDRRGNTIKKVDANGNIYTNSFDGLDRPKISAGPVVATVSGSGTNLVTNVVQQIATCFYDGSGQVLTVSNALGERTVTASDPIGRPIRVEVFSSNNASVRVTTTGYNADHNSVTVTNGSGTNAIVATTFTDTEGHPVLNIGYPTNGVIEYDWQKFDPTGNRVAQQRLSSSGGTVTTWETNGWTYDGLNRVATETTKDGVATTFGYNALGNVTNRTMPGGLTWNATYLNDGRIATEFEHGGSLTARSNSYTYYPSNSPFAGLLATRVDGRGTLTTNIIYDDFLRLTNLSTQGAAPEQSFQRVLTYDAVGNLLTGVEWPTVTNFGLVGFSRGYDAYNHVTSESTGVTGDEGAPNWATYQTWDSAGRRTNLITGINVSFGYRADGLMSQAGGSSFTYTNNGLPVNRTTGTKTVTYSQRDGRGRLLQSVTALSSSPVLTENLTWRNDGRLNTYSASRDFTDSRNYTYSSLANRLTRETFAVSSGNPATNNYTIDNNQAGGLGILTAAAVTGGATGSWAVISTNGLDGLSRVAQAQDSLTRRTAVGTATGAATVLATLDGRPLNVLFDGNVVSNVAGTWLADMDLSPGSHSLSVSAVGQAGSAFGPTNNTFYGATNSGDTIQNTYDGNGNVTKRAWVNGGQTNRTQTLIWDAFDRLASVAQRDTNGNGFNWTVCYDALGRRMETRCHMVLSNSVITGPSGTGSTIDSWYDPQVEFGEVGVQVNGFGYWKTLGPDVSGVYGGMQGVGGVESVLADGEVNSVGVVQDYFGNVIGSVNGGSLQWNSNRFSSYGPVPGYQPAALSPQVGLVQCLGWRGERIDETGLFHLGARHYDAVAGRFLSADPLGHGASMDLYSFCGGDPVNFFDSTGRCVDSGQDPPSPWTPVLPPRYPGTPGTGYSLNRFYSYAGKSPIAWDNFDKYFLSEVSQGTSLYPFGGVPENMLTTVYYERGYVDFWDLPIGSMTADNGGTMYGMDMKNLVIGVIESIGEMTALSAGTFGRAPANFSPRAVPNRSTTPRVRMSANSGSLSWGSETLEDMPFSRAAGYDYDAFNVGPLGTSRAAYTFAGGRYSEATVQPGQVFFKAGDASNPGGSYFGFEPPSGIAQARIDGAVKAEWVDSATGVLTGRSPINSVISARFPAGTKYYYGPVSSQGGVYVGGPGKIQIYVPNARNIGSFTVEGPLR